MIVLYRCLHCYRECQVSTKRHGDRVCKACRKAQKIEFTSSEINKNIVDECVICHHRDFYVRDDIRKGLGLIYLLVGLILAYPTYGITLIPGGVGFYWHFLKYPRLTVCYHCYAKYRNVRSNPSHREYNPVFFETLEKQIRNDRCFPH